MLPEEAAIFTDGRYTLQVRSRSRRPMELPVGAGNQHRRMAQGTCAQGRADRLRPVAAHRANGSEGRDRALAAKGAELVAVAHNPIDKVWADRPEPSKARLVVQPDALAGQVERREAPRDRRLAEAEGADAAVLAALDSIAWTFNVRGADVDRIRRSRWPMRWSNKDGTADLFVEAREGRRRRSRPSRQRGARCTSATRSRTICKAMAGKLVAVDPERSVAAIAQALEEGGARVFERARPGGAAQGNQE